MNSVVVEMEKMLAATDPSVEWPRWSKPCIYKVPQWLKKMTSDGKDMEAYRPRLVSLGPFHHGDGDLLPMEEHKRRAVLHIVKRLGKPLRELFTAIEEVADELMDAYHGLDEKWGGEGKGNFVQVMVVDGCFLLEIMKGLKHKAVPEDYALNDPVFSYRGIRSLWLCIRSDMLMIENQLPLLALYRLEAVCRGRRGTVSTAQGAKYVNELVLSFVKESDLKEGIDSLCLHPLDIFHKSLCGLHPTPVPAPPASAEPESSSMPAAAEMRIAGIIFQKSEVLTFKDISFKNGVLRLPALSIHHGTKQVYLNLMAYERLHSDTGTVATDYMIFMDNIIDSERDVALLRSKGIIKNLLSSDKDASNFYNILSRGAVLSPHSKLHDVRRQVNGHCKDSWNRYWAFFTT